MASGLASYSGLDSGGSFYLVNCLFLASSFNISFSSGSSNIASIFTCFLVYWLTLESWPMPLDFAVELVLFYS